MSQDRSACCAAVPAISDDEIRERAHDLWERHHRPEGFDMQFWFMAQRELLAERRSEVGQDTSEVALPPAEDGADSNPTQIGEC